MEGLKAIQDQIKSAFEDLKKAGETQAAEIKKFGEASGETKAMIDKINTSMDEAKKRIDEIEMKMNRKPAPVGPNGEVKTQQQIEQENAFFKYVREGKAGLTIDERKSLVEDGTGQIIVPFEMDQMIYRILPKLTIMRSLASARTIGTNRIRRFNMNEVTTGWGKIETAAPGSQLGSFESSLVPSDAYIYVEDAYGLTKIGEDELEDSQINLQSYIADSLSVSYGQLEDTAFFKGTGHANSQPEGVLNGTTVTRSLTKTVNVLAADDIISLPYDVKPQYRKNGKYVMNSQIEKAIRLLKDGQGRYLWQPSVQAGVPATFSGYEVYNQEDLDNTAVTDKEPVIFGDFKSGYQVVDRNSSSLLRLNELYAEQGLVGFKFKRRVGGGVVRPEALRVLKVQ